MLDQTLQNALAAQFREYKGEDTLAECQIDQKKAHALFMRLTEQEGPARAGLLMDELKDVLLKQQENVSAIQVIRIKRPKARITIDLFSDIKTLGQLESQFLTELETYQQNPLQIAGLILFSAINHGGLLKKEGPALLLKQLAHKRLKSFESEVWFELDYKGATQSERWHPDGLTTLLIDRFFSHNGVEALTEWIREKGTNNWRVLLKSVGLGVISTARLFKASAAKSALNCSPALIDCATGIHRSQSLSENSYLRGISRQAPFLEVAEDLPTPPRPQFMAHSKPDGVGGKSDAQLLKEVGQVLRAGKKSTRKQVRKELDGLIAEYQANCTHITVLLCKWASSRQTSKNRWGNRFEPSSTYTRLRNLARRLRSQLGSEDPTKLDPLKLVEVYEEVVDEADTPNLSKTLRKNLRDFHEYLEDEHGVESLEGDAPWNCLGTSHAEVDANILWPHEYYLATEYYQAKLNQANEEQLPILLARYLALVLGYRCGMRRREVLYLRLADIHLKGAYPEILVRPHSERDLKSRSGNRRIPISVLLTHEELSLLELCVKRLRGKEYLFAPSTGQASLLNHAQIFDHITWLLQQITGNPRARYHQLRHSFATQSFYRWMHSGHDTVDESSPYCDSLIDVSEQRKLVLGLKDGSQSSPKVLHAIAMMIGHSGPALTLEHYIHSANTIRALQQDTTLPILSNEALIQTTGIGIRQLQKLADSGSLFDAATKRAKKRLMKLAEVPDTIGWVTKTAKHIGEYDREVGPLRVGLFDYWQAILAIAAQGYSVKEAADRFYLDTHALEALVTKAKGITQLRYTSGAKNLRHRTKHWLGNIEKNQGIFFGFPKKHKDLEVAEEMLGCYAELDHVNKQIVDQAVDYFVAHGNSRDSDIPFTNPNDLKNFVSAYGLLGFDSFIDNGKAYARYVAFLTAADAGNLRRRLQSQHWKFWNQHLSPDCVYRYERHKKSIAASHGKISLRLLNKRNPIRKDKAGNPIPVTPAKFENWYIKRQASWGFRLGLYLLALQRILDQFEEATIGSTVSADTYT